MPGPFDIEWFDLADTYGNTVSIPKCTAIALITSSLSMLKTSITLNLSTIHLREDFSFSTFVGQCITYLPFLMAAGLFRLSAISILATYANVGTIFPVSIVFAANVFFAYKR